MNRRRNKNSLALRIISLNIADLVPSEDNFYSTDDVADLKLSIEIFGVNENLIVKPISGGKYKILSGHRRHKACTELVTEGKSEFAYVPCAIQKERDDIKERILMIIMNSTIREMSDYERMKQSTELQRHYAELKRRDGLHGRVRDLVAEALNTSATQLARLNAICKNLIPELILEFKKGHIGVSVAYELSTLPVDKQLKALIDTVSGDLSLADVKRIKDGGME